MTRGTIRVGALLFGFLAAATSLMAQTYHGGLRGAVRDSDGVTPGAAVTLVNEATNGARHTTSNASGEYAFVNVEPGTYTVKVSMQGFKGIESKGVRIATQQFLTLDFTLAVGQLEEQVTVEGQVAAIETSNASVGSTLDSATLETLPSAGRNAFFLATTTPGVVATGDPQFVRQQDQTNSSLLSLGGGPRRGNNYTLDGVSIVDLRNRAAIIPSIEGVEEVKVQVNTYDAEIGRSGGGVFNMTGKSGANTWHGSVLGQARPGGLRSLSFFARKACETDPTQCAKPKTYNYIYGGSLGGPIVKDKTFFWASIEGYKSLTIDDAVVRAPNAREISGDFSQSGVTIFDPLTTRPDPNNPGQFIRDPFPGNIIPANRINPIARAFDQYWPKAGPASAQLVDRSYTGTFKLDQQWNDKVHSSALYGHYNSKEPQPRSYLKDLGTNPSDPGDGLLLRTVDVLAVNNTVSINQSSVAHVRFGYTTFADDCVPIDFDPGTLGFSSSFAGQVPQKKFPYIGIGSYGTDYNGYMFGDRPVIERNYYSWDANASISKLIGRHTVKTGASLRKIGVKTYSAGQTSGTFLFDGSFTSGPDPQNASPTNENALAQFLLGFPHDASIPIATRSNFFINYYAGYLQDDWRVNSKLALNLGLRYEFEQGLQEKTNAFTVGFDRDRPWPFQLPGGPALKGGLQYAGVDGYNTHQSDPSKTKFSPRLGFAYSIDTETVVRGGYGLFWSPNQYLGPTTDTLGTRGFTAITNYLASTDGGLTPCQGCTFSNPFPSGLGQPTGSASGILTGAGGEVQFVDQFRKSTRVHQFSFDVQRELPGRVMLGVGYIGARTRDATYDGTSTGLVNINQLDPKYLSLGSQLLDLVPNPFFGDDRFGNLSASETIPRGQLLRPYPQFGDILGNQVSGARTNYDSVVFRLEKRISHGWGGGINYTWSRAKSDQFGELNQFSNNSATVARPINTYDLDREYSLAITDTPHHLNLTFTGELPFAKNKTGLAHALLSGWSISGTSYFQSGFPVVVIQANNNTGLFSLVQRPNTTGTSPATSGSTESHYDPSCSCLNNWFNTGAWTAAQAYTLGNAPRTDARMRTPFKTQTDIAIQKSESVGGGRTIQFRAEIINLFNNTQFNGPGTRLGSSNFGQIASTRGFPRLVQILVRYAF